MASISKYPVNRYNFIRWHVVEGGAFPFPQTSRLVDESGNPIADYAGGHLVDYASGSAVGITDPDTLSPFLPNAYSWPAGDEQYVPLFVPNESVAFYLNFYADLEGYKVAFVPSGSQDQIYHIDPLVYTANENYYQAFNVPIMPNGRYNLVLINSVNNVAFMSNPVDVRQPGHWDLNYTISFSFSHHRDMYQYLFRQNLQAPYKMRLHANQIDYQFSGNFSVYEEATTGLRRLKQFRQGKTIVVETTLFDQDAHEAFGVLCLCKSILMNGRRYITRNNYKVETDKAHTVCHGTIEMDDAEFVQANITSNC